MKRLMIIAATLVLVVGFSTVPLGTDSQASAANVTLKKGLVRGASVANLFDWINSRQINQIEKKDIFIRLCDENGEAVISWKVVNAFPTKLEAPTFDANADDVAVESMELMADAVFIEEA